MTPADCSGD